MSNQFMLISLRVNTVVPHDMVTLGGQMILADLVQGVASGNIPATLNIETASDASLADLSPFIREQWLYRLAGDMERLKVDRRRLGSVAVNDDAQIAADFLAWAAGTPVSDIEAWFRQAMA